MKKLLWGGATFITTAALLLSIVYWKHIQSPTQPTKAEIADTKTIPTKIAPPETKEPPEQNGDAEFDIESINLVIEKSASGKVEIDDKMVDLKQVTLKKEITDNSVVVESRGKDSVVTDAGELTVRLPDNYAISMNSMSGSVRIQGISTKRIRIETMSGDIRLRDVTADSGRFKAMSGSIHFKGRVTGGNIELESMSGDVDISLAPNSDTKIEVESEKSSAMINDKRATAGKLSAMIQGGKGRISGRTISGTTSCDY